MMRHSENPIVSTIPLDATGVHHGFLRLPCSREDSAWGVVLIPIAVIRNGEGPTALLTGGNHGDEYEGPVALQALAHELDPRDITGRVIIVPFMNTPAVQAGKRLSPLDGCNLNRIFPGRPDGTATEKIADYFLHHLVPLADIVLDYHSGGKTLDFVPFAAAHILDDEVQQHACAAAMRAFNAPYSMMLREIDGAGMYDSAVEEMGKVFISTELGGGGTATARSIGIARRGVTNMLKHAGIVEGEPEIGPSIDIDTTVGNCFHFSEDSGLLEPMVDLGEEVRAGTPIARIWPVDRSGTAPCIVEAQRDGILAARHFPGLIKTGDCLAVVAAVNS